MSSLFSALLFKCTKAYMFGNRFLFYSFLDWMSYDYWKNWKDQLLLKRIGHFYNYNYDRKFLLNFNIYTWSKLLTGVHITKVQGMQCTCTIDSPAFTPQAITILTPRKITGPRQKMLDNCDKKYLITPLASFIFFGESHKVLVIINIACNVESKTFSYIGMATDRQSMYQQGSSS